MDVCREKHKRIDEKLDKHDSQIESLSEHIDILAQFRSSTEVEMRNLVVQIKSLVDSIKWMVTSMILTLGGFFIWYIQNL